MQRTLTIKLLLAKLSPLHFDPPNIKKKKENKGVISTM
jgi:hypothetical protein